MVQCHDAGRRSITALARNWKFQDVAFGKFYYLAESLRRKVQKRRDTFDVRRYR